MLGDGLEKHTVDVRDLKLYAIDDSVLTELISEDADLYWILEFEFEDDYYLAGTDEEKEKYHLRKIKPTVKESIRILPLSMMLIWNLPDRILKNFRKD